MAAMPTQSRGHGTAREFAFSSPRRFMRLPAGALACLFVLTSPVRPGTAADAAVIDALVQSALRSWHVPGVAVAIVRNREVVYLKGHGVRDAASGAPVTPDTVFPLASCSKAFTSAALAVLVDEGKLSWDDPVHKHVPFFHLSDPLADRDVRIRDLLCHRTGVGSHDLLWYHATWSPEEAVRRVGLLPLDKPFRTAFQYQSTMYTAAGFAVKSAGRMPWEEFVRERLTGPLGMTATVFTSTAAGRAADRATGYAPGERGEPEPMPPYPLEVPDAAGSVHSTARDLARWLVFHLDDGTANGRRLVSEQSLGETHRPQMVIPLAGVDRAVHPDTVQMSYGMGWVIQDYRGRKLVSHAGIIDGFRCHLTMAPDDKLGVVILTNLHRTRMNQALSNALVDRMLGLPSKDWNAILGTVARQEAADAEETLRAREAARHRGTRPSGPAEDYVGAYEHPAFGTVRVTLEHGRLVWAFNAFSAALEHYQYDTFALPLGVLGLPLVRFTRGEGGAMESLHVGGKLDVEFRRAVRPGR
jgi:CubicO group peptidase (beta-lactamase class C family)